MGKHNKDMLNHQDLFHRGTNFRSFEYFGSHKAVVDNESGAVFRLWAPNAIGVSVVGSFCDWELPGVTMDKISEKGIYEVFIPGIEVFDSYKYAITSSEGEVLLKTDPYAYHFETRPSNASKFYDLFEYEWEDDEYIKRNKNRLVYDKPVNIYEVHAGSWMRHEDGNTMSYIDLAEKLSEYAHDMGYTHVQLLPITEHPYDGSWGYQTTGYYAPTSRFGTPHDFMKFVDIMHQKNIGVILDWVPSHFPKDDFALAKFDGGFCYEDPNPFRGEHKEWGTLIFDFGKPEVRSFLISSAVYWLEKYHLDGLRVDAVASMLYLDYNRRDGEAVKNYYGGNENLEAIHFIRQLNTEIFRLFPNTMMIAEESTAWPLVTKPVSIGGLGFNYKWNMGWMNDFVDYMSMDPFFRKDNHDKITFSMYYAFSENYVLPLSHDEVVHGKGSLINKMPGEYLQKFSSLQAMLCYMMSHPGKKLLFMGQEFAQFIEWDFDKGLDWFLLDYDTHRQFQKFVKSLNNFYLNHSEFYEIDDSWEGFRWVNVDDRTQNIISFLRYNSKGDSILVIINFSPVERSGYLMGVPVSGDYEVIFNSCDFETENTRDWPKSYATEEIENHGFENSISLVIPPLSGMYLRVPKPKKQPNKKKPNKPNKSDQAK